MRILLPPSEAKRAGGPGRRAKPSLGAHPGDDPVLAAARAKVAAALIELCSGNAEVAAAALRLPARAAAGALADNRAVLDAARRPAIDRYSGIVYDGLDVTTLTAAARRRTEQTVLIFSGLWGVVGAAEPVPSYRLPVAASLPALRALTGFWRPVLADIVPTLLDDELIVDLRSTDYAAMWRPARDDERHVGVRVLTPQPGRAPAVISYPSKLGKGRLVRALVGRRPRLTRPAQIIDAWRAVGGSDGWETGRGVELLT
ncbi:MAG: peroxide stress protein YaaA [Actinobacteria bacterium]|nr:peroxide stress protein YaaA [Actinomycetota bacterium]